MGLPSQYPRGVVLDSSGLRPEFCVSVTGVGKTDPCALLVRFWCASNLDLASTRAPGAVPTYIDP
jgi:hypothetical protein